MLEEKLKRGNDGIYVGDVNKILNKKLGQGKPGHTWVHLKNVGDDRRGREEKYAKTQFKERQVKGVHYSVTEMEGEAMCGKQM